MISLSSFAYDFEVDGIYYNILSAADKTVEVTSGDNIYSEIVQIPEKCVYSGITFTVTAIGENAFYKTTVKEVKLPSSITNIGKSAFMYCEQLHTCDLHEGLKEIGVYAFVSTNLTSVVIPSTVTTIGTYAFEMCKMKTIEFSEGISQIVDHAFSSCDSLEKITFPSTLQSVKAGVFDNCPKIKIIVSKAKNSPSFFDSYWFSGGRGTHTLYNPFTYSDSNDKPIFAILVPEGSIENYKNKTTSDGKQAWPVASFEEFNDMTDFSILGETMTFENCLYSIVNAGSIYHLQLIDKNISENLVNLHIPEGLDYNGTFYSVSSINPSYIGKYKSITSIQADSPNPISISEETFSSNTMLFGTLYVPTGSESLYSNTDYWKNFANVKSIGDKLLIDAKTSAKSELASYKNIDDYREAQKTELTNTIKVGNEAIDAATTIEGVNTALAKAKAVIDAIKTDAQLTEEEVATEVAEFRNTYATILSKTVETVTVGDKDAIDAALTDYDQLSDKARDRLKSEKELLDALKQKVEEIITGIDDVLSESHSKINIYTLSGKKVNSTQKGRIYIINGKKTFVKKEDVRRTLSN